MGRPHILHGYGLRDRLVRKQAIKMEVWRVLLRPSVSLHKLGEVQAIDATGFGRRAVSQHYGNRIRYYVQAVKTAILGVTIPT